MNRATKLRSELVLRRIDELFVHQHVVRRFKLNHVDECNTLESLRKELEHCLSKITPDLPDHQLLTWQLRTSQLSQCINHFDIKANLRLVATGASDVAYKNFVGDLYAGGNGIDLPPIISRGLADDDDACTALFEILRKYARPVLEIHERLNFLDYYSPLAMTSFVEGASMYLNYLKAMAGIDPLRPGIDKESAAFSEARWLFTIGAAMDEEFAPLVHTYCYRSNKPSRNIKVIGGNQHTVTINGETIDNCLFFCVPTNQIPDRIDESLRYFRDALVAELNGYLFEAERAMQKFESSRFMNQFSRLPLLVKDWDQVQKNIVGLWVWDKVNLEGFEIGDKPKQVGVYAHVRQEMQSIKDDFEHELEVYAERSIKGYSEYTSSMIGSVKSKNKQTPRALDEFITGESICLGRRDNH